MNLAHLLFSASQELSRPPRRFDRRPTDLRLRILWRPRRASGRRDERTLGLRPGDRVALAMTNNAEYLAVLFAIWRAGLVAVPVNAKLHPREIAFIASDCEARLCIASPISRARSPLPWRRFAAARAARFGLAPISRLRARRHRGTASDRSRLDILHQRHDRTSEGRGAQPSQSPGDGDQLSRRRRSADPEGQFFPFGGAIARCRPVRTFAHREGDASGADAQRRFRSRRTRGVVDHHDVGFVLSAADRASPALRDPAFANARIERSDVLCWRGARLQRRPQIGLQRFGGRLWNGYGQGESPCTITAMSKELLEEAIIPATRRGWRASGFSRSGVEVDIFDEEDRPLRSGEVGEVVVRGDTVMSGYWNLPTESNAALRSGWLHTGDLGAIDQRGYLTLLDRTKDLIIQADRTSIRARSRRRCSAIPIWPRSR